MGNKWKSIVTSWRCNLQLKYKIAASSFVTKPDFSKWKWRQGSSIKMNIKLYFSLIIWLVWLLVGDNNSIISCKVNKIGILFCLDRNTWKNWEFFRFLLQFLSFLLLLLFLPINNKLLHLHNYSLSMLINPPISIFPLVFKNNPVVQIRIFLFFIFLFLQRISS
jgi:hypothetical protein